MEDVDQENTWPDWSGHVRTAWHALKDDRFYGAMGGMGRIYYSSISQYAADFEIPIHPFATFLHAMDAEFVTWSAEKAKEEADKTKTE